MLIWGWTTKNIGQEVTDWVCSHCQHDGLVMVTFQRFFTLFFVPAIPLNKNQALICCACSTEYNPTALGMESTETPKAKTPFWGFSGVIIITMIIGGALVLGSLSESRREEYLASPRVNDIIVFKDADSKKTPYVSLKIQEVKDDMIIFKEGRYAYSHLKNAKEAALKDESGDEFLEEAFEMPISDLKELDVVTVER